MPRSKKIKATVIRTGTVRRIMRRALQRSKLRLGVDDKTIQWARRLLLDRMDFLLREAQERAWSLRRDHIIDLDMEEVLRVQETEGSRQSYLQLQFGSTQ